jgi:Protein of unknown function (DUF3567)
MLMLYNSDSYAVVQIEAPMLATGRPDVGLDAGSAADGNDSGRLHHGGFEIVDKFARKQVFLQGAMAERFKVGAMALIETQPSEEEIDDYIEGYAALMQQPVVLH